MLQNKRKIVWWIESVILLIFIIQMILLLPSSQFTFLLPLIIIQIFVYSLISLIFYYVYDDKSIFSDVKIPVAYPRTDLSEGEKTFYYNRVFLFTSLLKLNVFCPLFISFLGAFINLTPLYFYSALLIFFILLPVIIVNFTKVIFAAKGYRDVPAGDIIRKYLIYYNPDDKRTVIDKPFGVGLTVNLATKQGKLILGIVLAVPLLLISLLILVLALKGKI